jgi:hypothetical protein
VSEQTAEVFCKRYFVMPRSEIGYLRFLLEGYDGLAFARTLEQGTGLIEIAYSTRVHSTATALLHALGQEIPWREVARPTHIPSL